ncbi:RDD family protein [Marinomonas mediterranea]|uniref:RDD domain containing protein n=1 Tax=Marinomonas mediterranea (strain ATCC 700492 / JCM 21426 / NBRC 103028 / MMB-1) TaxID=717774 RepID=F2JWJ1_MARM1|nr:RDD family protein [Marinomonas mediterranea]ADZ90664.1 RDD domain containing protein [Marinomonas mediterranea MMB-1]
MGSMEMENLHDSYKYSGFWIRMVATLIDSILMMFITMPLLYSIYGASYFDSSAVFRGVPDLLISYVFPISVTILFWVYKSATPGKMAMKLKVVDAKTGNPPSIQQSIIRYVGYFIAFIPLFLGVIWIAWDRKKQGWHDKMAGTLVVRAQNNVVEDVDFSEA